MDGNEPNQYEVIDSKVSSYPVNLNNTYPRYPIANNSNSALQNTNYKDWLATCQGNSKSGNYPVATATDTVSAVSAGIIVVGTMLAAFVASAGIVGGGLISFGTLAPILWPAGNPTKVWTQFMTFGETLLDEKISETVKDQALGKLKGFTNLLDYYENAFNEWYAKPNAQNADLVAQRFEIAHASFVENMSSLATDIYKILLLPVYAQAANLHLNLLQQAVLFADKWNSSSSTPRKGTSEFYYKELKKYTGLHIDHCSKTYREGLITLKNRNANYTSYNTYHRDMTLTVLDLIATFPNFDTLKYPIGTKSELTREIYTTFIDSITDNIVSLSVLLSILTRPPHLFTNLRGLDLFSKTFDTTQGALPGLSANINLSLATNDTSIIQSPVFGDDSGNSQNIRYNIPENINVMSTTVKSLNTHVISQLFFDQTNDNSFQFLNNRGEISQDFFFPTINGLYPLSSNHSHILSFMKTFAPLPDLAPMGSKVVSFAWTHVSVNHNNTIAANEITQIRGVKTRYLSPKSRVVTGPAHLGGDLVELVGLMEFSCRTASAPTQYAIRIRYAANRNIMLAMTIQGISTTFAKIQPTFSIETTESIESLKYDDFIYSDFVTLEMPLSLPPNQLITVRLLRQEADPANLLFIDRIEFIPLTGSLVSYMEEQKVEKAKKAVSSLFVNNSLKTEITDYQIDQIASQVECISEDSYLQEKMILLDEIKFAKQLSQSRNLIVNGDFKSLTGWNTNNDLTVQSQNPTFKGNYLNIPGARVIEISNEILPTQIHQKIDETKLKPFTRYKIRGYVGSSQDLELLVTRYGIEVNTIMNIPYDDLSYKGSVNACSNLNQFESKNDNNCSINLMVQENILEQSNINYSYKSEDSSLNVSTLAKTICHDPQEFSFHIDTGELDFIENPGIWVIFKISDRNGYATLGNLEVIEDETLAGEELTHVKHLEQKWKEHMASKRKKTEELFYQAKEAVDALFIDAQNPLLKIETTFVDILAARSIIDSIPYVYNEFLPDSPGMNYAIYNELINKLTQANCLYDIRNKIKNGHFTNGLMHWHASPDAHIQKIDDASILVVPSWSTQVCQNIELEQGHRYMFRVTAKKEGLGTGYVRISDCKNHIETVNFTSCDNIAKGMSYANEYVTKIIYITPQTKQVRIDIGETEGLFKISSLEMICK